MILSLIIKSNTLIVPNAFLANFIQQRLGESAAYKPKIAFMVAGPFRPGKSTGHIWWKSFNSACAGKHTIRQCKRAGVFVWFIKLHNRLPRTPSPKLRIWNHGIGSTGKPYIKRNAIRSASVLKNTIVYGDKRNMNTMLRLFDLQANTCAFRHITARMAAKKIAIRNLIHAATV